VHLSPLEGLLLRLLCTFGIVVISVGLSTASLLRLLCTFGIAVICVIIAAH
jgi:hypothetical protein